MHRCLGSTFCTLFLWCHVTSVSVHEVQTKRVLKCLALCATSGVCNYSRIQNQGENLICQHSTQHFESEHISNGHQQEQNGSNPNLYYHKVMSKYTFNGRMLKTKFRLQAEAEITDYNHVTVADPPCSCHLKGYGKLSEGNDALFVFYVSNFTRVLKISEGGKFHKVSLDFKENDEEVITDLRGCFFLIRSEDKDDTSVDTMCFDGQNKQTFIRGNISAIAYDNGLRVLFVLEPIETETRLVTYDLSTKVRTGHVFYDGVTNPRGVTAQAETRTLLVSFVNPDTPDQHRIILSNYSDINVIKKIVFFTIKAETASVLLGFNQRILISIDGRIQEYHGNGTRRRVVYTCKVMSSVLEDCHNSVLIFACTLPNYFELMISWASSTISVPFQKSELKNAQLVW